MLSARVVRAAPNHLGANNMRATVLCGQCDAWEAGPRTAADLKEATAHYERAAALSNAPLQKAAFAKRAGLCRQASEAM